MWRYHVCYYSALISVPQIYWKPNLCNLFSSSSIDLPFPVKSSTINSLPVRVQVPKVFFSVNNKINRLKCPTPTPTPLHPHSLSLSLHEMHPNPTEAFGSIFDLHHYLKVWTGHYTCLNVNIYVLISFMYRGCRCELAQGSLKWSVI